MVEHKAQEAKDEGLTLIELLVAMLLGTVVMSILVTILVGVYGTQDRVSQSANLTSQAQIGADLFRQTLRSSTASSLITVNGASDQLLVVRSFNKSSPNTTTPSSSCVAFWWRSSPPEIGSIYWASAPNKAGLPATPPLPTLPPVGWVELVPSVGPVLDSVTQEPILDPTNQLPLRGFSVVGRNFTMAFTTQPAAGPKSTIRTSVLTPNVQSVVTGGCY